MSKSIKIWLVVSALLIITGCIVFACVMSALEWDFAKLSTTEHETNSYEIDEEFGNIKINTDTADVVFAPSENSKCSVECYEQKNVKHSVTVKDGELVIEAVDSRKWYEYIGINFVTSRITVYLPAGEYGELLLKTNTGDIEIPKNFSFISIDISESTGNVTSRASSKEDIKITTTTGNICVESISAKSLALSVSTGELKVSDVMLSGDIELGVSTGKTSLVNVACKSVISSGSTGEISLSNVIAKEKLSIKRSTGSVRFDHSDAAEIFVETSTGDVTGTLLSGKAFITDTSTGRIDVPKTANGGRCKITTSTGDIIIAID